MVDGDGAVRATPEQMLMVIDTSTGRPGRFQGEPLERLEAMAEADRAGDRYPSGVSRDLTGMAFLCHPSLQRRHRLDGIPK